MSPATLHFRVSGGARTGLGHVTRSAALARAAVARGEIVSAEIEGDAVARQIWQERSGIPASPPDGPLPARALVVLDGPGDKREALERLESRGHDVLLIDDDRAYGPPIHGGLRGRVRLGFHHAEHAGVPAHLLEGAGPQYALIDPVHLAHETPLRVTDRRRVLLCLGGADPSGATLTLAPQILRGLQTFAVTHGRIPLDVVLGPASPYVQGPIPTTLAARDIHVHRAPDAGEIARLMRRARFAVVGFGSILGELAWHETPCLTLTHHESDRVHARDLERAGLARVLGTLALLERIPVEALVRRAWIDLGWQASSARHARDRLEGGLGADRILGLIEALRARNARRASTAARPRNPDQAGGGPTRGPALGR